MWVFELLLCVCVCVWGEALRIQEVWSCGYLNCFFVYVCVGEGGA